MPGRLSGSVRVQHAGSMVNRLVIGAGNARVIALVAIRNAVRGVLPVCGHLAFRRAHLTTIVLPPARRARRRVGRAGGCRDGYGLGNSQ
jgi:hypothetical protein